MKIRYAAVHASNRWRTHKQFTSLYRAVRGHDGAEARLLQKGRVVRAGAKFGSVLAILVWREGELEGLALRCEPGRGDSIQRAFVGIELMQAFESQLGPTDEQLEGVFATLAEEDLVTTFLSRGARQYVYGDRPAWDIVREAALSFERPASLDEIGARIAAEVPEFNRRNLGPDLSVLSVNCKNRGHYAVNYKPRRTDSGSRYDQLFRTGAGGEVRFERYQLEKHGVWALVDVGEKALRPRLALAPGEIEIAREREASVPETLVLSEEDARRRSLALIVQREGQQGFRKLLLEAYGGVCAVTGCSVEVLLEAAHIVPYNGPATNAVANGLLLRADVHKLFDLHLMGVDHTSGRVRCSEILLGTEYWQFEGVLLRVPKGPGPDACALSRHRSKCSWMSEQ